MQPIDGNNSEFCTHREVKPYAGTTSFDAAAWCPECVHFKLRRVPKKRSPDDYATDVLIGGSAPRHPPYVGLRFANALTLRGDSRVGRVPRSGPGDSIRKLLRQVEPLTIGRQLLVGAPMGTSLL